MKFAIFALIVALTAISFSEASAWRHEDKEDSVTPYGDFCPECSKYGTCKTTMTGFDAEKALKSYYDKKGLKVEIEKRGERFIRARVYNKKRIADIIIFDRRTGRVRSIY